MGTHKYYPILIRMATHTHKEKEWQHKENYFLSGPHWCNSDSGTGTQTLQTSQEL